MNTEILQEELLGDGASSCPIEGNQIIFSFIYTYTNLPVGNIVRLPHLWRGDSQG